jgi:dolichol-phosphate mannosyltransferase
VGLVRVTWVIPCFQEEEALDALGRRLASVPADEIVFVDDGSTDRTPALLEALSRADPRVRVRTHPGNRGVGAALRTGAQAAEGDVVVAYDADMTYPVEDARLLVEAVASGADVATASPFLAGGGLDVGPFRRLLSRGASLAYRLVLGSNARGVRTFTCGFRAYRRGAVQGVRWRSDGFPATAEVLARLLLAGARVVEVPSRLTTRLAGRSKMRTLRALLGHLRVLSGLLATRIASVGREASLRSQAVGP